MAPYLIDPTAAASSSTSSSTSSTSSSSSFTYELYGVINHIGGSSGGHYTSFVKKETEKEREEEKEGEREKEERWYCFNDSFVSRKERGEIVTPAAYVLFYQRKKK